MKHGPSKKKTQRVVARTREKKDSLALEGAGSRSPLVRQGARMHVSLFRTCDDTEECQAGGRLSALQVDHMQFMMARCVWLVW